MDERAACFFVAVEAAIAHDGSVIDPVIAFPAYDHFRNDEYTVNHSRRANERVREEVIMVGTVGAAKNGSHSSGPPFRAASPNSV